MDHLDLRHFSALDELSDIATYVTALETFDAAEALQELKATARERSGIAPGKRVLDVGCGFGLETARLAALVEPGGRVAGIDKSARFIEEAEKRAAAARLEIDYRSGDAEALPYDDASFDSVRIERALCYLTDPAAAVREMMRVLKPGGSLAIIEPDFVTKNVNLPHRDLVRRVLDYETSTAVVTNWVPGLLFGLLQDLGLEELRIVTRVVIFPPDTATPVLVGVGRKAAAARVISEEELAAWLESIATLHTAERLMLTSGYFLFTGRAPQSL